MLYGDGALERKLTPFRWSNIKEAIIISSSWPQDACKCFKRWNLDTPLELPINYILINRHTIMDYKYIHSYIAQGCQILQIRILLHSQKSTYRDTIKNDGAHPTVYHHLGAIQSIIP